MGSCPLRRLCAMISLCKKVGGVVAALTVAVGLASCRGSSGGGGAQDITCAMPDSAVAITLGISDENARPTMFSGTDTPGQMLNPVYGSQGGYNLWVSIEATGLANPKNVEVSMHLTDAAGDDKGAGNTGEIDL